jgi:WD40 repeat protein
MISSFVNLDPIRWSNSDSRDAIRTVEFSPDGRYLAASSQDKLTRVWTVGAEPSLTALPTLLPHPEQVRATRFSPDHRWLATATLKENVVRLWPMASLSQNPVPIKLPGGPAPLAFGPAGRLLATGVPGRNTVALWEIPDRPNPKPRQLGTLPNQEMEVLAAAIDQSGHLLATAGANGTTRLWDITNPANPIQHAPLIDTAGPVYAVAFSPDGTLLAAGYKDNSARLWDVHDPTAPVLKATLSHPALVLGVAFSPDGHTLATASEDTNARLWDITDPANARPLADPLAMGADNVYSVAFAPNGHTLASASHDRTVQLWETDIDRVTAVICALPQTSREVWHRYLPKVDYRQPCPDAPPAISPVVARPDATTLMAGHSRQCVTSPPGGSSAEAPHQGHCGAPGTSWRLHRDGTGPTVRVVAPDSGLCLDGSDDAPPGSPTVVRQQVCSPSGAGQLWRLNLLGGNGDTVDAQLINLVDPAEPRCLDVYNQSQDENGRLVLWPCGDANKENQRFTLSAAVLGR